MERIADDLKSQSSMVWGKGSGKCLSDMAMGTTGGDVASTVPRLEGDLTFGF